jgi:hypothetical protein
VTTDGFTELAALQIPKVPADANLPLTFVDKTVASLQEVLYFIVAENKGVHSLDSKRSNVMSIITNKSACRSSMCTGHGLVGRHCQTNLAGRRERQQRVRGRALNRGD